MIDHEDGLPDDRVLCTSCAHLQERRLAHCRLYRMDVQPTVPLRCVGFKALPQAADQRSGHERWPGIQKEIDEIRKLEREYAEKRP